MELNDAVRRIFGQHWRLIAALAAVGMALAALAHLGDSRTYTANTRLVFGTEDPKTQAESASIADTAKAIATSPTQVREALRKARAGGRDPVDVARDDVSVKSLGASGVLELGLTDGSPRVAAGVSNALAHEVVRARLDVTEGQLRRVLANLDPRIARITRRLARLETQTTLSAEAAALRSSLTQQRTSLESERVSALTAAAQQPKPSIISEAPVPAHADSSGLLPDLVLGALLGLILGVGVASLIETLRPTIVGGGALARELNAPLLGGLSAGPDRTVRLDAEGSAVLGRLRLATKAAGVRNIGLLGAGTRDLDLPGLAHQFDASVGNGNGNGHHGETAGRRADKRGSDRKPALKVRPYDIRSETLVNGNGTGLVLVSPNALKKEELDEIKNLLAMSPGPLLGVLTYAPAPLRRLDTDPDAMADEQEAREA